jgi:5-methylcytosine-specific restriction endonuclease McrA
MRKVIPPKLKLKILARDNYLCQYCAKDGFESFENWCYTDVDHFDPTLPDAEINNENNLVTACRFCNSQKGNKEFRTIQEARAFLVQRRIEKFKEFQTIKKEVRG